MMLHRRVLRKTRRIPLPRDLLLEDTKEKRVKLSEGIPQLVQKLIMPTLKHTTKTTAQNRRTMMMVAGLKSRRRGAKEDKKSSKEHHQKEHAPAQ